MRYVIYALFQVPGAAETALHDLATAGLPAHEYHLFIRKQRINRDLRASECDGRPGLLIGLVAGIAAGALLGWLLAGPLGLLSLPIGLAMGFGIFLGCICGALGGGIYGTRLMHRDLQRLVAAFQPGQTLITAEIDSLRSRNVVESIFKRHGAMEASA